MGARIPPSGLSYRPCTEGAQRAGAPIKPPSNSVRRWLLKRKPHVLLFPTPLGDQAGAACRGRHFRAGLLLHLRRRTGAARVGHPRRGPHRTAAQVQALGRVPVAGNRHEGRVHPRERLRRRGGIAGHRQAGHGLAGRLHLRAGQDPHQGHGQPHRAACRGCGVHLALHHGRSVDQDAGRPEGQDLRLWRTFVHLGQPDAPLLHPEGRYQPREGFQERGLLRCARCHRGLRGRRQGRRGRAEHLGVGQAGRDQEGRPRQGARVPHHARVL